MKTGNDIGKHNKPLDLDTEIDQILKTEEIIRNIRHLKKQEKRKQMYLKEVKLNLIELQKKGN